MTGRPSRWSSTPWPRRPRARCAPRWPARWPPTGWSGRSSPRARGDAGRLAARAVAEGARVVVTLGGRRDRGRRRRRPGGRARRAGAAAGRQRQRLRAGRGLAERLGLGDPALAAALDGRRGARRGPRAARDRRAPARLRASTRASASTPRRSSGSRPARAPSAGCARRASPWPRGSRPSVPGGRRAWGSRWTGRRAARPSPCSWPAGRRTRTWPAGPSTWSRGGLRRPAGLGGAARARGPTSSVALLLRAVRGRDLPLSGPAAERGRRGGRAGGPLGRPGARAGRRRGPRAAPRGPHHPRAGAALVDPTAPLLKTDPARTI